MKQLAVRQPVPRNVVPPEARLLGQRAAVIVFSFYPSDVRVMRSAEAMSRSGMDVDLLCLQQHPDEPRREHVNGVQVSRLALKKRRGGKLGYAYQYLAFLLLSFCWLSRRHLTCRYQVVHIHNMPDFLVFAAAFAKVLGSKVVLDLHDPTPEVFMSLYGLDSDHWLVRLLRRVEMLSTRFADLVLTPNIAFRNLFVARGCSPDKIEIVMNSPLEQVFPLTAPVERRHFTQSKDTVFALMFHGTLVERHGLRSAIEAVALLKNRIPGIRFDIYGEETQYLREEILPLVSELGLQQCVHYQGEQPQPIIAKAVADCDLGIVPNLRTVFTEINLPTRIFEYLALGKPVIVPDTKGIRDYFEAGNILSFNAGDAESLASRIQWVFDHPLDAASIVKKGQEIYRHHLWSKEEWRLLSLISDLIP
jgi:glycosyltransferase involved in cell wall biosynthesis